MKKKEEPLFPSDFFQREMPILTAGETIKNDDYPLEWEESPKSDKNWVPCGHSV